MKARSTCWFSFLALGCLLAGCSSSQDRSVKAGSSAAAPVDDGDDEEEGDDAEEAVALDQVPEAIKQAALAAVPGLVLVSAERETEEGSLHYCLEGTVAGEAVEVEVRASDEQVVEIERGEDEED